jgi:hypothetical protein
LREVISPGRRQDFVIVSFLRRFSFSGIPGATRRDDEMKSFGYKLIDLEM